MNTNARHATRRQGPGGLTGLTGLTDRGGPASLLLVLTGLLGSAQAQAGAPGYGTVISSVPVVEQVSGSTVSRLAGYEVTYEYEGKRYTVRMPEPPGARVRVGAPAKAEAAAQASAPQAAPATTVSAAQAGQVSSAPTPVYADAPTVVSGPPTVYYSPPVYVDYWPGYAYPYYPYYRGWPVSVGVNVGWYRGWGGWHGHYHR